MVNKTSSTEESVVLGCPRNDDELAVTKNRNGIWQASYYVHTKYIYIAMLHACKASYYSSLAS